jgi:hypothetical protein
MTSLSDITIIVYVVASLTLIIALVVLLLKSENKDNFCTCSGMNTKLCRDPNNLKQLYSEGKLTEYNFSNKSNHTPTHVPAYDAFSQ